MKKALAMIIFAVTCGSGNLAFGQDRSRFFVAMPDKASAMIIGTDPAAVCAGINFIHAETGLVTVGTSGGGSNCLGTQSSVPGNCSADGSINCFVPSGGNLKAVAGSDLKSENIRKGITIGGVKGEWPSPGTSSPNSTATKLTSLGVTALTLGSLPDYDVIISTYTKKEYTLFGDDGKPYKFWISSVGTTVAASTTTANYTTESNTLFKGFTLNGDSDLIAGNIKAGVPIFGVIGKAVPRNAWSLVAPPPPTTTTTTAPPISVLDWSSTLPTKPTLAKAQVYNDPVSGYLWMLLLRDTTTSNPLTTSSADANTKCGSASVSFDTSTYGNATSPWSLPSEKDVLSAQVTGGTGAGGLFANEGLISGNKFWIKTTTAGSYEVVNFSSATAEPTNRPATDSNLVVCVYKKFGIVNTNQALLTANNTSLRANVMMSPDSKMQVAYIYATVSNGATPVKRPVANTTNELETLCSNSSLSIPTATGFSGKTWRVLDATDITAYGPQFMSDPFIGTGPGYYNSTEAFWLRSTPVGGTVTTARYKIDSLTKSLTLSSTGDTTTAAAICVIKK